MALFLEDIAAFFAAAGFGVYDPSGATSTIFVGTIPDTPNTLIALEEYVGIASSVAWTIDGAALPRFELPRVHITVRGEPYDYSTPRMTIEKIYQFCFQTYDRAIGGAGYNRLTPLGSGIFPMPVNADVNGRRMFTLNVEVMKTLSPTA